MLRSRPRYQTTLKNRKSGSYYLVFCYFEKKETKEYVCKVLIEGGFNLPLR